MAQVVLGLSMVRVRKYPSDLQHVTRKPSNKAVIYPTLIFVAIHTGIVSVMKV